MAVKPIIAVRMAQDLETAVVRSIGDGDRQNIDHLVVVSYLIAALLEYDDTLNETFHKHFKSCCLPARDIFYTLQKRFEKDFVVKNPIDKTIVEELLRRHRLP